MGLMVVGPPSLMPCAARTLHRRQSTDFVAKLGAQRERHWTAAQVSTGQPHLHVAKGRGHIQPYLHAAKGCGHTRTVLGFVDRPPF